MAKRIQRSPAQTRPAARAPAAPGGTPARGRRRGRVPEQVVTDFTSQLATLSGAGIPIVKALTILAGQTPPGPFKGVLTELVEDVSSGTSLSESMAKHGRVFDTLYSSMVRAGEAGGVLEPNSSAAILIYENSWAAPCASALRRGGAQLVAHGVVPMDALLEALD